MTVGHDLIVADGKIKTRKKTGLTADLEFTGPAGNGGPILPAGCTLKPYRPVATRFRRATIIVGRFMAAYRDDIDKAWKLGIQKPAAAPTAVAAGTGITGNVIIYYDYMDWEVDLDGNTVLVHEGNISAGAATLALVNQGVDVTLPATAPDARTTHIGVYASVDGDIPQFVDKVTLGTTAFHWGGPVGSRGAFVPVNSDGTINADARGVPPDCTLDASYGDRCWYNSIAHPERAYYSLIDEPEAVGPLAFVSTRQREAIVAMGDINGDQLVLACAENAYDIQAYSGAAFVVRRIVAGLGCIGQGTMGSMERVVIGGRLHWMNKKGAVSYGGGGKPILIFDSVLNAFWADYYKTHRAQCEDAQACYNADRDAYKLLIPGTPPFYFIGSYAPAGEDGLPEWSFDDRTRNDNAVGTIWDPTTRRSRQYVGGADGFLRQEDDYTNTDDDGDTLQKRLIIVPKHFMPTGQSGSHTHGNSLKVIDLYIRSEGQGPNQGYYTVSGYGGDDPAVEAANPTWGPYTFPSLSLAGAVAETVKRIRPTMLSGVGFAIKLVVTAPVNFEYRGIYLAVAKGPQSRGRTA